MNDDAEKWRALVLDYQAVFRSEAGLKVLRDLMAHFGYTRKSTLVPGEPLASARNEGQRTVLIHVGRYLDADITRTNLEDDDEA